MLKSSQRAKLRSMASHLEPILHIGKDGLTQNTSTPGLTQAIAEALEARELIKATVQKNSDEDVRDVAHQLAEWVGADVVQVIGRKFVLYRESKENKRIEI